MKKFLHISIFWTICASLLLSSCKNDNAATGETLIDDDDKIVVYADTVGLCSQLCQNSAIISSPDSFLLGEMETPYGTLKADILTQFACPIDFKYPENAIADSIALFLTYTTWTGDGNDALEIDAHYLDKATLDYQKRYYSDINDSDYCSGEDSTRIFRTRQIVTPEISQDVSSATTHIVNIPLTDEFCQKFFHMRDFSDQKSFNEQFKGLYITTTFGGSAVLNVGTIQLVMYYHFTYEKAGRVIIENDSKGFYANSEVRQVNRFRYLDEDLLATLSVQEDSSYIISPAGVYTSVKIPVREMCANIFHHVDSTAETPEKSKRRPYVNRARLRLEVLNYYTGTDEDKTSAEWAQPAENIMLIRKTALSRWFENKESLADTCAINASLDYSTDTLGRVNYYYTYDMSTILTNSLREMGYGHEVPDTLEMVLVPVDVQSTTSSSSSYSYYYGSSTTTTITGVRASQLVSNTIIRSGKNQESPMRMEVVYSGF